MQLCSWKIGAHGAAMLTIAWAVGACSDAASPLPRIGGAAPAARSGSVALYLPRLLTSAGRQTVLGVSILVLDGEGDRLQGVSWDLGEPLLYEMTTGNGGRHMRLLEGGLAIQSGEPVHLKINGDHVIVKELAREIVEGERFDLVFHFERAGDIEVEVPVIDLREEARISQRL